MIFDITIICPSFQSKHGYCVVKDMDTVSLTTALYNYCLSYRDCSNKDQLVGALIMALVDYNDVDLGTSMIII